MRSLALTLAASIWLGCRHEPPAPILLTIPPDTQTRSYDLIESLSELPPPLLEATLDLCDRCEIADVGENFQETDVITLGGGPPRRLIRAGHSGPRWFVHYEHGGRGYHEHTALFDLEGASAVFAGGATFNSERGAITHVYSTCSPRSSGCEW